MENTLLIDIEIIKNSFPVKNVDEDYIKPSLILAQEKTLQLTIGTVLYDKMTGLVSSGEIELEENKKYKKLLESYIYPVLLWSTMAELVYTVTFKVRNAGTVQNYGEHINTATFRDADEIQNNYLKNADFYIERLIKFLMANNNDYKEYHEIRDCADFKDRANLHTTLFMGDY